MEIKGLLTRAEGEYPELKNCFYSSRDVQLLKDAYAGRVSEMTALSQYMYQYIITKPNKYDIAHILEEIAINEMIHAELLAEAIVTLGGNPKYVNARNNFWTSSFVNYNTNIKMFLKINIDDENKAINYYKFIIKNAENKCLIPLIERIIKDEEIHIIAFKEILKLLYFWE